VVTDPCDTHRASTAEQARSPADPEML
jgi:hypothetical protein